MKQHRFHLAALVLALALLFNLERLDLVGGQNGINLSPLVYILATLASLVGLLSRRWSRLTSAVMVAFWLGTYLLAHAFMERPLFGGIHTYVTVTEIALLIGIASLTLRLGCGVTDFEEAVCTLTLGGTDSAVRSMPSALDEVNRTLLLSRRNERPLSVLVVEPIAGSNAVSLRAVETMQRSMLHRFIVNSTANVVADAIRRTDIPIQKADDGRLVVICPDTDEATVTIVMDHIRDALRSKLGLQARFGLANFPGEGYTFDALLGQAEVHLGEKDRLPAMERMTGGHGATMRRPEQAREKAS